MAIRAFTLSTLLLLACSLKGQKIENYFNLNDITCSLREGDTLWIGTEAGLVAWQISTQKILAHYHQGNSKIKSNQIKKVLRSPDGLLWVYNGSVLSWFDGTEWNTKEYYGVRYGEDLGGPKSVMSINDFAVDKQGVVWVAHNTGVDAYHNGKWEKKCSERVPRLFVDEQDRLWFQPFEVKEAAYYDKGELHRLSADSMEPANRRIYAHISGRPWMGAMNGFQYFNGKHWEKIIAPNLGYHSGGNYPNFLYEDQDGRIWLDLSKDIAVWENGSYRLLNIYNKIKGKLTGEDIRFKPGWALDVIQQDQVHWVIFNNGIYNLYSEEWHPFLFDGEIEGTRDCVNSYLTDDGGLLVLTNRFMIKLRNGKLEKINLPSSSAVGDKIMTPKYAPNGDFWLCFRNGVARISDNQRFDYPMRFLRSDFLQLSFDTLSNAWFFDIGGRIVSISSKGETTMYGEESLPGVFHKYDMKLLPFAGVGMSLLGLGKCLTYADGGWQVFKGCPESGLFEGAVQRDGVLWLAKDSLYTFAKEVWENKKVKLISNFQSKDKVFKDAENAIWAATDNFQLIRIGADLVQTAFASTPLSNGKPLLEGSTPIDAPWLQGKTTSLNDINVPIADRPSDMLNGEPLKGFKPGKYSNVAWSENYVAIYKNGKWRTHKFNFLHFQCVEDSKGNWWNYAPKLSGLCVFNASSITEYKWKDLGMPFERAAPENIFIDSNQQLWFTTSRGIVLKSPEGKWSLLSSKENPAFSGVVTMVEDKNGTFWLGSMHSGLIKIQGDSINFINSASGLFNNDVRELYVHENKLYVFHFDKGYSVVEIE